MRKAYYLPVLAAGILFLSGCAGSHIDGTHTTTAGGASVSPSPALAAAMSEETASAPEPNSVLESSSAPESNLARTSGSASKSSPAPGSSRQENASQPLMIYVRDTCLTSVGRPALLTCGTADGTIQSQVASTERPSENGQANFDCQGSSYISLADGAAAVDLDGSYILFLADDMVEYNGIYKKKSEVSDDTLRWLDFYYSLPETDRNALSMVPTEFIGEMFPFPAISDSEAGEISYLNALTDEEILQTELLAQQYFSDEALGYEGVDQIYPVDSDTSLYNNIGLEGEYALGNIIIYKVLTVKDRRDGSPFRFISIARNSKSDDWKVINSGY